MRRSPVGFLVRTNLDGQSKRLFLHVGELVLTSARKSWPHSVMQCASSTATRHSP